MESFISNCITVTLLLFSRIDTFTNLV